jgi:Na+-transporting NADH:ubiquinone oxidoreductase subunit F
MQKISSKLIRVEKLTSDVSRFDFSGDFDFKAGQFVLLNVKDGKEPVVSRAYSIASLPGRDEDGFSLCVKLIPGGRGSEYLRALQPGDEVEFQGPSGHFVLNEDSEKDLLFVATGVGLSPFISMLEHAFEHGLQRQIKLLLGTRFEQDIFHLEQLERWQTEHDNFSFDLTLSRPTENWTGLKGYVTDHLQLPEPGSAEIYICGNGQMVKDVKDAAQAAGFPREDVHFELFTPIKS